MKTWCHTVWALLMAITLATACGDGSCYNNGSSLPLARFYTSGTTTTATVTALTVRGIGVPGDSLLIDSAATSEFFMPLRATTTVTQYELTYGRGQEARSDTITLHYRPIPYFASHECGAMYNYEVSGLEWTHHVTDSVTLAVSTITNAGTVALRIYLPASNQ